LDRVLAYVQKWRAAGIVVYGVRLPVDDRTTTIEDAKSGFVEEDFVARFERAGGVWIVLGKGPYETYDGSHLCRHAALRLSGELSRAIATARLRTASHRDPVRRR